MIKIPPDVGAIINRLEQRGFSAYLVGGCVRDSLLNKQPGDWDVTTDATPAQVAAAFFDHRLVEVGSRHGTVGILRDGRLTEVTTMRRDGDYLDHRRPQSVDFTQDIAADLSRRDFTVNAMAYSARTGLIDPFGGRADLQSGLIRAVGRAETRFEEDALRILRALRVAATLRFQIEPGTARAAEQKSALLACIAPERCMGELQKLLVGQGAGQVIAQHPAVLAAVIPEIAPAVGFDQRSRHHRFDLWTHTARAVAQAPPVLPLRLALLLHDLGKPASKTVDRKGKSHYYGHPFESERLAAQILARLRAPNALKSRVLTLIGHHHAYIRPTQSDLHFWLHKLGHEDLHLLLEMVRADNRAKGAQASARLINAERAQALLPSFAGAPLSPPALALKGGALAELGLRGPAVGRMQRALFARVMRGQAENSEQALAALAQALMR